MRSKCDETLDECKNLQILITKIKEDMNSTIHCPIEVRPFPELIS